MSPRRGVAGGTPRNDSKMGIGEGWGTPLWVFRKNVILKGLDVRDAQECESRGVTGDRDFRRRAGEEKEGVTGLVRDFMEECSMRLRVCQ